MAGFYPHIPVVIAGAQNAGTADEAILSRHLPIIAGINETTMLGLLEDLIRSMEEANSTELAEALKAMKRSIEAGDRRGFTEAQEQLSKLVREEPGLLVELDEETLRQLLLLASMNITITDEGLMGIVDPRIYEGLEEYLAKFMENYSGREASRPPGSLQVEGSSVREALEGLDKLPEPPRELVPSIYEKMGAAEKTARESLLPLLILAASIGIAYAGYRARSHVVRGLSSVRASIARVLALRAAKRSAGSSGSPREAVIACYRAVTGLLARMGYPKMGWETHREYYNRLRHLPWSSTVGEITEIYEKAVFSPRRATWDDALRCARLAEEVGRD